MDRGSYEYRLIARWIASGTPAGDPKAATVARIETYPASRTLRRGGRQQLVVTAHYSDGSTEDVTRWAQFQSNDAEVATVAEAGRVESRDLSGQAAIMARYQGHVAVCRVTVPRGAASEDTREFPVANVIDSLSLKQWQALGIAPSELCGDAELIRRASIDVTGTLPTADEVKAFVADPRADKRARLVDSLLERPEYAAHFATKWADVLRNKRENNPQFQNGTYRFHDWIRVSLAANVPYDRFVRSILGATGSPDVAPASELVSPLENERRVRRRHRAGVPGHAVAVRQVPPPPVRKVEPRRLLRTRRVLRSRRPQARGSRRNALEGSKKRSSRRNRAKCAIPRLAK